MRSGASAAGRVIVRVRPERIEHEGLDDSIKKQI